MKSPQQRRKNSILSISESISVSLGLQYPEGNRDGSIDRLNESNSLNVNARPNTKNVGIPNNDTNTFLGRSYVSGILGSSLPQGGERNTLPVSNKFGSRAIHEQNKLHRQTAAIAEEFDDGTIGESPSSLKEYLNLLDEAQEEELDLRNRRDLDNDLITDNKTPVSINLKRATDPELEQQTVALLTPSSSNNDNYGSVSPEENFLSAASNYEQESTYQSITVVPSAGFRQMPTSTTAKAWMTLKRITNYMPAAILGLLLNILDALSYGMIIFPITEPIFAQLGPTGISMFYISTIISQFIYSSGWSSFPSGIGSEMIEITPFYHTMALAISQALPGRDDEIITTTIFCYVISSVITGLTFYLLGKLRLGKIVGFFPRHILIGCIGGVGYFLIITGLEVTTRIAKFEYSIPFLTKLFLDSSMLFKWLLPTILTIILIVTQKCFKNSLVLPSFYIITLILFHFVVAIAPNLSLHQLRKTGWIFPAPEVSSKWYDHYRYFDIGKAHWSLVVKQIPTMLALTFFGILHVPINVPALAMSLQMDKYDVDKELIAHGYSNFFSGLFGSVQNYLVYTNSVLFIRAGADSAIAGYVLIVLTIMVMVIGPVIISFIPICIVGSLIFLLGYELLVEAMIDPFGKVTTFEYATIGIIVLTMGIFDFVLGIVVGILIACFSFLVDSTKLQTVNGEFDGTVAKSTVYRDFTQTRFLSQIGEQIYVLKLQNILFFGTIISIEEKIERLLEISDNDVSKHRIKFLILDFKNINADNIDYSAAEGFNRIKRYTEAKRIKLIISTIRESDRIYHVFNQVGLLQDIELFNDLNSALEWCENEFLYQYKELREKARNKLQRRSKNINAAIGNQLRRYDQTNKNQGPTSSLMQNLMSLSNNTPRNYQLVSAAQQAFSNEQQISTEIDTKLKIPDPLLKVLLFALKLYRPNIVSMDTEKRTDEVEFWKQLCPYFTRKVFTANTTFLHNNNFFFLVDAGILKVIYNLPAGSVYETLSNGTCYGKILSKRDNENINQNLRVQVETDTILWIIDEKSMEIMKMDNIVLYTELVLLILAIRDTRFKELLGYTLVSA
ncbi:uncharacterized protein HLK63_I06039 [Nakaseomyces glabratus]|nr:hypothetical protein LTX96_0004648 [Nakaseomyces glabratus]OXB42648.1 hypothetical protein B1J91_I10626g [Nakaseomyces glabratus]OXB47947.1 hypothetical protein B1J92_I10626g [Nakaseomyces glabratus]UCS21500.1 uncharacterized protein GW608_I06039 [Nakaseomyces glabratus]UCS26732.1 uncharacterized protein HLK63_I06039 [Nakaseomyces glabratus]